MRRGPRAGQLAGSSARFPRAVSSNRISLFFAAVLWLLMAGAGSASAPVAAHTSVTLAGGERQAQEFWTPARMRRARPLDTEPVPVLKRVGGSGSWARGPAHRYPARAAAPEATGSSFSELVPDPTLPLYAEHGVVFIVIGPGFLGRCSATSVNAPNLSLVFTAGHCVHEGRGWLDRKWVFVPGYHYGIRPFGIFAAKWLGSTPGWIASENENFDVGAAVVSRNERGQKLAATVGGAGIAWNLSPRQVFDVYGYPVEEPFDGATLQRCPQTAFEGHDITSFLSPGPLDLAVQCDVTAGASGGGWLIGGNTLNGITTNGYEEDPTTDFGPYFGSAVGKLFREAAAVR
jgi:V8-like Glu-specific endopeptidase